MPRPAILDTLTLASPDALARLAERGAYGAAWYADAAPLLAARASAIGVETTAYIDVLAILSPRCRVARNVAFAEAYLTGGWDALRALRPLPGVMAGLRHWEATGIVRGPKVGPFARALAGDQHAVVVDTWIARAFVPRAPSKAARATVERYQNALTTKAGHREATRRVAAAARKVGLTPRDCQAAIWHGVYRGSAPGLVDILASL